MIVEHITDEKTWDDAVQKSPHPTFLQSWAWGQFQLSLKRKVFRLAFVVEGKTVAIVQGIQMPGRFWQRYIYCPRGPLQIAQDVSREDVMQTFVQYLKDAAHLRKALFVRYDPIDVWNHPSAQPGPMMQPWATRMVDLSQTEEELLAQMKSKTRYNIRLATRYRIEIKAHTGRKPLKHFLKLLHETSKRQGIKAHPDKYYRHMEKVLSDTKRFWIYEACRDNITYSVGIFVLFAGTAYYLHGASSERGRTIRASYALQWQAMCDAKKHGAQNYDFFGVAGTSAQERTWAGITQFKEGFGGRTITFEHTKEIPLNEKKYRLFRALKRS